MTRSTKKTVKLSRGDVGEMAQKGAGAVVVLQGAPSDIGVHRLIERATVVGRGPGADLVLLDQHLSRRHCVVLPTVEGAMVQDLGSKNGTLLNGIRILEPKLLHDGDHIFVAETVLKFSSSDSLELSYHASMDERVGTDELTGLVARHRFEGQLLRALESCVSARTPLGVMMLDIDGIKQINDHHGHLVGAFTIAETGKLIGRLMSSHGVASRLGGDEFAVFLPRKSKKVTVELARVVILDVEAHVFKKDDLIVHPTISIGVAAFPDDGRRPEELLGRADEALLRAKQGGRNRVEVA